MNPLEKMIRSSNYGKREMTDEQVAEAMAGTGPAFDVNSLHPSDSVNAVSAYPTELIEGSEDDAFDGHMVITEMTWADYADIQKLDRLFVQLATQEYAELYHKLASEHTEDTIVYQLNQYNSGITW